MIARPRRSSPHDATVSAVGSALGWSVATRLLQFVLSLAGSILVVRGLGPDRYGMLTVLRTSLSFLAALCGLGLGQAMLRYLPAARARGDRAEALRLIRWTALPQLSAWLLALPVVWLASGLIARLSFPQMATLFFLGTALVVTELAYLAGANMATAFYDTRGISAVTLVGALSYLSFVALALYREWGVAGVLVATGASNLLMIGILLVRLWGRFHAFPEPPAAGPAPRNTALSSRDVVRYALPFAAIAIMNLITWRQSETIFLAHFRTLRESGFFDLAYRIPQLILEFVPGAIWPLLMAGFSEIYTRDRGKLNQAIAVYYKLLFLLVAPVSLVGAALGDRVLVAFYGAEMSPAGPICQIFFLVFSISFFSTPLSMAFYVLEKPWYSFWLYLINSVVIVGLDLILIPRYGLVGAIIPVSLVITASPFMNYVLLKRCGIRPDIPWGFLLRVYLAVVPCALLYPARQFVHGKLPVALAVLVACCLYLAGLRLFRVMGREEAALLERSGLPFAPHLAGVFGIRDAF